jgi:hypothetical protein
MKLASTNLKKENDLLSVDSDIEMLSGVLPDILFVDCEDSFECKQQTSSSFAVKTELIVADKVPCKYVRSFILFGSIVFVF